MHSPISHFFSSCVSHGSPVEPSSFKLFFFDSVSLFILITSVLDFAINNSLTNNPTTVGSLKRTESKRKVAAIKWLYENRMIVNSDKFQLIALNKCKSNNTDVKNSEKNHVYHQLKNTGNNDKS